MQSMAQKSDECGKEGDQDHRQDDQRQMIFDCCNVAEKVSCQRQTGYPDQAAQRTVQQEQVVAHRAYACDERREGAYDGHEARDHDRLAAMLLIECVGSVQMFLLQESSLDAMEEFHADQPPYPVIGVVAGKCGQHQHRHQQVELQCVKAAQGTCDEEQRIARQERREYQTGFGEDDQEQDAVHPCAIVLHQRHQVHIQVQNKIDKRRQKFQNDSNSVSL